MLPWVARSWTAALQRVQKFQDDMILQDWSEFGWDQPTPEQKQLMLGGSGSTGLGARVGDAPRVEIAKPADVSGDPFLTNWVKTQSGPVNFDGTPCSFPGRVWKSKVGNYWNMLCALVRDIHGSARRGL